MWWALYVNAGETHMLGGVSYMSVSQDIIFLSRYTKQPMHSTIFQKILNYIEKKMDEGTTKVYTEKIWNSSYGNCNWAAFQPPQMLYIYSSPEKSIHEMELCSLHQ